MRARDQRALLVTPTSPWAVSFGAQQRTALFYESLAEMMPVDVLLLNEGDENASLRTERPEVVANISWKQPPLTLHKYRVSTWVDDWCRANIDWSKYALVAGREFTAITKVGCPASVPTMVDCDDAYYRYTPRARAAAARAVASVRG